jgi:hypothetical protein
MNFINDTKQKNFMFHVLRNPHGWSEEVVREMRLKAVDELERLYALEAHIDRFANELLLSKEQS